MSSRVGIRVCDGKRELKALYIRISLSSSANQYTCSHIKKNPKKTHTPISTRLIQDDSFFDAITNSKNFHAEVHTYCIWTTEIMKALQISRGRKQLRHLARKFGSL